jgi:dephospho-CoA kinase
VARDVTPPGSDALAAVVDAFGSDVLREDGSLDRAALGRIVFADPEALARLEAIIHPAVRPRILELMAAAQEDAASEPGHPAAIVVEAIKLIEGGLAALCDEIWLVTCDPAAQRERLAARGVAAGRPSDPGDTEARIAAQSGLVAQLTPAATRIIDTSGSLAESRSRIIAAFEAAIATRASAGA